MGKTLSKAVVGKKEGGGHIICKYVRCVVHPVLVILIQLSKQICSLNGTNYLDTLVQVNHSVDSFRYQLPVSFRLTVAN